MSAPTLEICEKDFSDLFPADDELVTQVTRGLWPAEEATRT